MVRKKLSELTGSDGSSGKSGKVLSFVKRHKYIVTGLLTLSFLPTIIGLLVGATQGTLIYIAPLFDLWWWRPFYHGLFYVFWANPWFPLYGGLLAIGVGGFFLLNSGKNDVSRKVKYGFVGVAAFACVMLFASLVLSGMFASMTLADQTEPNLESMDELPQMNGEDPRFTTEAYARTIANNQLRTNTLRVNDNPDITYVKNDEGEYKAHWSMGLEPDTTPKRILGSQEGAVFVPMDSRDGGADVREGHSMKYGMGVVLTDSWSWQQYKQAPYTHNAKEAFMVEHEDDLYIAVPREKRNFHMDYLIPYTTPEFAGVTLYHEDGTVENLSPEEAHESEVLEHQNYYPYDIATAEVMSLRWVDGYFAKEWDKETEFELANIPGEKNSQPFLIDTENHGLKYIYAVEPYGDTTHGVSRMFVVDARSGSMAEYDIGEENALTGPVTAANFVEQDLPRLSWENYQKSEPLPVMVDSDDSGDATLYWMYRVTRGDGESGIAYVSFVNAEDPEDVRSFQNLDRAVEFMTGEDLEPDEEVVVDEGDDGNTITISVVDESGETVQEITVEEGQSVVIDNPKDENDNSEDNSGSSGGT